MIYLKKFIIEFAEEKEIKLLEIQKGRLRVIEREMEKVKAAKQPIDVEEVVGQLARIEPLKKKLDRNDWNEIRKEISKMK